MEVNGVIFVIYVMYLLICAILLWLGKSKDETAITYWPCESQDVHYSF